MADTHTQMKIIITTLTIFKNYKQRKKRKINSMICSICGKKNISFQTIGKLYIEGRDICQYNRGFVSKTPFPSTLGPISIYGKTQGKEETERQTDTKEKYRKKLDKFNLCLLRLSFKSKKDFSQKEI